MILTQDVRSLESKGPATCNDIVNDIVDDARADAIFATLKKPSSMISLRVAWPNIPPTNLCC